MAIQRAEFFTMSWGNIDGFILKGLEEQILMKGIAIDKAEFTAQIFQGAVEWFDKRQRAIFC